MDDLTCQLAAAAASCNMKKNSPKDSSYLRFAEEWGVGGGLGNALGKGK